MGEPINPEAWIWYWKYIGGERCPIVDTWWQTETGAIMITPLPGVTHLKPGSATRPFPSIEADILDESALVDNHRVAEAAVVARPDDILGQAIVAFVTLKSGYQPDGETAGELREHVAKMIGKIARPHSLVFTTDLPKTRSGKIMRRLLRDLPGEGPWAT